MPLWEGGASQASWRSWVIQYLKTFVNNSREKHRASASTLWFPGLPQLKWGTHLVKSELEGSSTFYWLFPRKPFTS